MIPARPHRHLSAGIGLIALGGALAGCSGSPSNDAGLEKPKIEIGLTGVGSVSNVPLYLADSLGYFSDRGLDVNLAALQGGSTAIQSLVTDTVDATTNEFVHTIEAQEQSKSIESVAVFTNAPSYALVATAENADAQVSGLESLDVGVVSLGGSTETLIDYVFETNGLDPDKARLVAVGAGSSQTNAVKGDQVDALIATEPTLTTLLQGGEATPMLDFRDPAVVEEMFGGDAPFWSLLVTNDFADQNPKTTRALVDACAEALDYIHGHSVGEVADELPADIFFPSGDRDLFEQTLEGAMDGFSEDGLMPEGGAERILDYLETAAPDTDLSGIDLDATYDDSFAEKSAG